MNFKKVERKMKEGIFSFKKIEYGRSLNFEIHIGRGFSRYLPAASGGQSVAGQTMPITHDYDYEYWIRRPINFILYYKSSVAIA